MFIKIQKHMSELMCDQLICKAVIMYDVINFLFIGNYNTAFF